MAFTNEFLSQDDVDALMSGMTGEKTAPKDSGASQDGVRTYNMATDERIVRSKMPSMDLINDRFSRYFRTGLFSYMHKPTDVTIKGMKVSKYSDFIKNLVVPANINLVQARPLRGSFLIVMDAGLVFNIVDSMFGGTGKYHTRIEGRDFTETEMRIVRCVIDVMLKEYAKAWEPVHKLDFEYIRSEMYSQFANVATPSEIVVTTTFEIEVGGNASTMHICFPYSMLEPIREILYSGMQGDRVTQDVRWAGLLSNRLKDANVELVCQFGKADLTLKDIMNFKVGDIIELSVPKLVHAYVGDVSVLTGRKGMQNGHYAIKVEKMNPINQEELMPKEMIND